MNQFFMILKLSEKWLIQDRVLASTPDNVMNKAIEGYRSALAHEDPKVAWKALMASDQYSTKQYLLG
jgi:hypothetical protein